MGIKLADVADVFSGHPFRGAIKLFPEGNGRVIQVKDVAFDIAIDYQRLVLTEVKGRKEPNWLQASDTIFLSRGGHYFSSYLEEVPSNVVCSPHFFVIRYRDETFHPGFIAWQLNQRIAQEYFNENAVGSGQKNIPIGVLKDIELTCLPMEQQLKLVALQSALIDERRLYLALLENRKNQLSKLAEHLLGIIDKGEL